MSAFTDVCGLTGADLSRPALEQKLQETMRCLGLELVGHTTTGRRIYFFPDKVLLRAESPTRVSVRGYTEDELEPDPQPFQVEVCRAWMRECARRTRQIKKGLSTDSLRRLATSWTRDERRFVDCDQVNETTGEHYHADEVYISNGAFLRAALDAGFTARRVPGTSSAWLNLSYRRPGQNFHGRRPKPLRTYFLVRPELRPSWWDPNNPHAPRPHAPSKPKPKRQVRSTDLVDRGEVIARLRPFLDQVVRRTADGRIPRFKLREAGRAARVSAGRGRAPIALTEPLRALGWKSVFQSVQGHRSQWWVRKSDAP